MKIDEAYKEFKKWKKIALKTKGKKHWEARENMNYFLGYHNAKKEIIDKKPPDDTEGEISQLITLF